MVPTKYLLAKVVDAWDLFKINQKIRALIRMLRQYGQSGIAKKELSKFGAFREYFGINISTAQSNIYDDFISNR